MKAEFDQFGLDNRSTCQYGAVGMTYFCSFEVQIKSLEMKSQC